VLVVGGGPVGLVTALLLDAEGIPFTLIEAETELSDDLRASTFHPPTLDLLHEHGLAEPLIAMGLVSPTWQIRMHDTHEKAEFDLGWIADSTGHPFRLQCEQFRLCRLILERLRGSKVGQVLMGTRLTGLAQSEDGVAIAAQRGNETLSFSGRFLIGADGSRSTIRDALAFPFEGKTYPETTILATTRFPFEQHLPGLSNVNYVWKRDGTFSLLRLPGLWRCSLYPDQDESIEEALTPESIERKLQVIVPKPQAYDVMEIRPYRIHMRIVDDYRRGRIVLAGDSAHLNSPSGGMGMNGGVHDAHELVKSIAAIWKRNASPDLLDRYVRRRRPTAEAEILTQADRNRARMQERDPELRAAMLAELQALTRDPEARRAHLLKSSMITGLRQAETIQ
jgi:3-(3-hydroxy-phenyl)propionate hydroxylase